MMQQPPAPYELRPLPRGWGKLYDEDTGRSFFIDNINKRTTWIDPRDDHGRHREAYELPFGWSQEVDQKVGDYFMDNINRRSSKTDPRTGVELPINPRPDLLRSDPGLVAGSLPSADTPSMPDDGRSQRSAMSSRSRASSRSRSSRGSTPDMRHEDVDKLVLVMREYEENEALLMQEGDRILDALKRVGADEPAIMSLTHGPIPDTDDDLQDAEADLNDFLIYNMDGRYQSDPSVADEGELDMDAHLQRLHRFINEQHSNLAVLRSLEAKVLAGGDISAMSAGLDGITLNLLQELIKRGGRGRTTPKHQRKLTYFTKLIACAKIQASHI